MDQCHHLQQKCFQFIIATVWKNMDRACETGQLEELKRLIAPGLSEDDLTVLISSATWGGHLDVLRYLVTVHGADPTFDNNILFVWAAFQGHCNITRYLTTLDGVDPSAQDNSALISAVEGGHFDTVQFLLTLDGVDPTAHGYEAIRMAIRCGYENIVRILIPFTPLHACESLGLDAWNEHLRAVVIRCAGNITDHWRKGDPRPSDVDPLFHLLRNRRMLRSVAKKGMVEDWGTLVALFL